MNFTFIWQDGRYRFKILEKYPSRGRDLEARVTDLEVKLSIKVYIAMYTHDILRMLRSIYFSPFHSFVRTYVPSFIRLSFRHVR